MGRALVLCCPDVRCRRGMHPRPDPSSLAPDKAQVRFRAPRAVCLGCFFERLAQFFASYRAFPAGLLSSTKTTTQIAISCSSRFDLSFALMPSSYCFVVVKLFHGPLVAARLRRFQCHDFTRSQQRCPGLQWPPERRLHEPDSPARHGRPRSLRAETGARVAFISGTSRRRQVPALRGRLASARNTGLSVEVRCSG